MTTNRRVRRKSLADAVFTRTQQRVLGVLFGQPERSFYASEFIRRARTGSGAAQRELARLESSGLVTARRIGHQRHYQANPDSPLFAELRAIILKTVGLAEPLRKALASISSEIQAAFVYGSVAKERDRSQSDIDVMVISESLTYGEVFGALERVGRTLGRQVNPTVYTSTEFSKRVRDKNAFVTRILEQPKVGSSDRSLTSRLERLAPQERIPKEPTEFQPWLNGIYPLRRKWDELALDSVFVTEARGKINDLLDKELTDLRVDVAHTLDKSGEITLSVDEAHLAKVNH